MDSGKKFKTERQRTPKNLNATVFPSKHSVTKRFSPNCSRRPNLNETSSKSSDALKIKKQCVPSFTQNSNFVCDISYNNYLQALLKKQCVQNKLEEEKRILEEQLLIQNENLFKRNQIYREIQRNTDMLQRQIDIVNIINFAEENIKKLKYIYVKYDIQLELHNFKEILNSQCDKVALKNIRCIETQEDYDKLMDTLKSSLSVTERIINSGRNFEGVHSVAETIKKFIKLRDTMLQSHQEFSEIEKDCLYTFLNNASDLFARQYDDQHLNKC